MRWFAGMERKRSKFGAWLEAKGIAQQEMAQMTGISQQTINNLATGAVQTPSRLIERKLRPVLQRLGADTSDFWDLYE
jgi:transcriptional regulator with XRE-family HTH domain